MPESEVRRLLAFHKRILRKDLIEFNKQKEFFKNTSYDLRELGSYSNLKLDVGAINLLEHILNDSKSSARVTNDYSGEITDEITEL